MLRGRKKVLVWRVRSTKMRRRMRIHQVTGKEQRAMWGVNLEGFTPGSHQSLQNECV